MKKSISLLLTLLVLFISSAASAETVYGTMNIPYADFFAGEGAADVDAVTSATGSKWKSPSFTSGAYAQAQDGTDGGKILGAVFAVAIDSDVLQALGENDYGFIALDSVPSAYKTASFADGKLTFSAVQGEKYAIDARAVLTASTVWGDYEIDIDAIHNKNGVSDIGVISGVLVRCTDGSVYALRHLENIWLDELSWSSGIKTVEPHGNVMNSAMYADMMGKTITEITYITDTGYHTLKTELYVPVKFAGEVSVCSVFAEEGEAVLSFTNLPEDYAPVYQVSGMDAHVREGMVRFADALPGAYVLTVSDQNGKYADLAANFVLYTNELPIYFDESSCALQLTPGSDERLLNAYLSNISAVKVNDVSYPASGRGAAAIIDVDGFVDTEAVLTSGKGADAVVTPIFQSGETYTLAVEAAGFTQTLTFSVSIP